LTCTEEHREVADAVMARDGPAAKAAMEHHIAALRASLLKRISYQ
jgi:DNA-binding GntR family transcriptional regulator